MTFQELKDKKAELDLNLSLLINNFEADVKLPVVGIDFDATRYVDVGLNDLVKIQNAKVITKIEL